MAVSYGTQMSKLQASPPSEIDVTYAGGRVRAFVETVTFSSQAIGDVIHVGRVPDGALVLGYVINTDTSTGTSTLTVIGGPGAAAAAYTSTNVPQLVGLAPAKVSGVTDITLTVGTAALPATGLLTIMTLYTLD